MSIFEKDILWERFLIICEDWYGTPYSHMQKAKRRGVDCTLFIAECLREAGFISKVEYDYYPRDWHIHTNEEIVLNNIKNHA